MQYTADSSAADPVVALRVIVDRLRKEGTAVEMVVEELPPMPAPHRAALIRVGREALRNAAKHAPGATVTLTLGADYDVAFVTVADDGPGFEPASALGPVDGHIGLALLAAAAEGVGGRLDLHSRPGKGTTVRLAIPVPPQPHRPAAAGPRRPAARPPLPPRRPLRPWIQADRGEQLALLK
jgi:signal transduction histidine kinase